METILDFVVKYLPLVLAIVAAGIADNRLIELLKVIGVVDEDSAPKVNNVLATLLSLTPVVLSLVGLDVAFLSHLSAYDAQVDKVLDALIAIAQQIPVAALISFVAAGVHELLKRAKVGLTTSA